MASALSPDAMPNGKNETTKGLDAAKRASRNGMDSIKGALTWPQASLFPWRNGLFAPYCSVPSAPKGVGDASKYDLEEGEMRTRREGSRRLLYTSATSDGSSPQPHDDWRG